MSENDTTLEYDGIELPIADLEAAIEQVTDENGNAEGTYAVVGEVTLMGDQYPDNDVRLARTEDVTTLDAKNDQFEADSRGFTSTSLLERRIGEARGDNLSEFAEFVEDEFDVEVVDGEAYLDGGDVDVTTTQNRDTFGDGKGRALDESDDVGVRYIAYNGNDEEQLRISLADTRDENTEGEDGGMGSPDADKDFSAYVYGDVGLGSANDINADYNPPLDSADYAISYEGGFLTQSEMQSLIESEGVEVGKVKAHDGTQYVGVNDTR